MFHHWSPERRLWWRNFREAVAWFLIIWIGAVMAVLVTVQLAKELIPGG